MRPGWTPFSLVNTEPRALLWSRGWSGGSRRRLVGVGLKLLARFLSAFLQLFLQLLLGLFELLRIGRRAVIGLGEFGERQRQRQRRAVGVDRLHHHVLTLLPVGEQFRGYFVVRHAAILEADHIRARQRPVR